jgi:PST family polysaccharide transporter
VKNEGEAGLRAATLSGIRWISIGRVVAETTALVSSIALARLIPPSQFGHAAVALTVVGMAAIMGPAGITAVLVQRRDLERPELEAVSFLTLAIGVLLTLVTIAFSHAGAETIFGSETANLIAIASPAWTIAAIGAVPQALLQRELRFRVIAVADSLAVLVGAGVAVGLALAGIDAKALVLGGLAATACLTAVAVIAARNVAPRPTAAGIKAVGTFSASVTASSFVYTLFRNVDYWILGARLGPVSVGYYWRAYQLGVDYQSKISQIMLRVAFPVYTRVESPDELRRLRRKIVRTHAVVIIPVMAFFIGTAPVLIPWVFGAAWQPAVRPAQIIAVAGIAYSIATGTGPLMVAVGKPHALLVWSVCELVVYAGLILVLAPHGIIAVSIGVAVFAVVSLLVIQVGLLRPFVGLPVAQLLDDVLPGLVAGVGVLVPVVLVRQALSGALGPVPSLAFLASVGAIVYLVVLRLVFRNELRDLESIVRRVGDRRSARQSPA